MAGFTPSTPSVISKEDTKKEMMDTIDVLFDSEMCAGSMYVIELLSLRKDHNYAKLQEMVNLKRMFHELSVLDIANLLVVSLDKSDLEELRGKML